MRSFWHLYLSVDIAQELTLYIIQMCSKYNTLLVLISTDFAVFDKACENLYLRKMLLWKILSFLGSFWDFCSISMANPRKYVPAKYSNFYHRENKYPQKLIPVRYLVSLVSFKVMFDWLPFLLFLIHKLSR